MPLKTYNASEWIALAEQSSGLPARGVDSLTPGLEVFLQAYAASTTPTRAGNAATEQAILDCLGARFRIEDWIVNHPQVLDTPVERPVFIVGLPRAGTTTLFNMLSRDKQRCFHWSWEVNREIPPVHKDHLYDDPRIAQKVEEINTAIEMGMLDHSQHVELGNQPAECAFLLGQDIKSYLWVVQAQMPEYFDWLLFEADLDSAYLHHRRTLQVLQSEAPGKWTLKFPTHAMAIDSILRIYPDARIIISHRDPLKSTASACDAERFFTELHNSGLDLKLLGKNNTRLHALEIKRLKQARFENPQVPFYDFHFRTFLNDPIAEIRKIYAFLGDNLSEETEQEMLNELGAVEQFKRQAGKHHYQLETFGLNREDLLDIFAEYIEDSGVVLESW